jgi:hypothetical protein
MDRGGQWGPPWISGHAAIAATTPIPRRPERLNRKHIGYFHELAMFVPAIAEECVNEWNPVVTPG